MNTRTKAMEYKSHASTKMEDIISHPIRLPLGL